MSEQQYPLDYDNLAKGSVVEAAECERITGVNQNSQRFAFALLKLKQRVQRDMERRGTPVTIKITANSLHVLTDAEASIYNAKQQTFGIRRQFRAHKRNLGVDATQLTAEELREHQKRLIAGSRMMQAIKATRRQLSLECRARVTPAIASN